MVREALARRNPSSGFIFPDGGTGTVGAISRAAGD
jgi:hypothetical protein